MNNGESSTFPDIFTKLNAATLTTSRAVKEVPHEEPFWVTCQVCFDKNGDLVMVLPIQIDGKFFSIRHKAADGYPLVGIPTKKEMDDIDQTVLKYLMDVRSGGGTDNVDQPK